MKRRRHHLDEGIQKTAKSCKKIYIADCATIFFSFFLYPLRVTYRVTMVLID